MARQQGLFALILALAIAAGAVLFSFPLQLGLDLRGGSQLTLQVLPAGAIKTVKREQLEAVKEVLDRRVNGLGVAESTLQTIGEDQLVLQLPGEQDPTRAAKVFGTTALLEFRAQKPGSEQEMQGLLRLKRQAQSVLDLSRRRTPEDPADPLAPDQPPAPAPSFPAEDLAKALRELGVAVPAGAGETEQIEALLDEVNKRVVALYEPALLTGKDLVGAGRQQQQTGTGWDVTLNFNRQGGEAFAKLTHSIAGSNRLLGIVLDGRSISEASVSQEFAAAGITGGAASITGNFTAEEAREYLLNLMEKELKKEYANMIKDYGDRIKQESKRRCQQIITMAIQRCAVDHVAESTVSVVSLASDDMKGRIIGREGRNI
ncbi:MAG: Rnase Y domain-containing protein, partial [Cyanobacteria bacterium]|nr:Rnase Y domain-containing protein [Cyanobacteriota bacterium]